MACDSLLIAVVKFSTDLLQVDCQNLLSTGFLQVVSTSCNKSTNDKLQLVHSKKRTTCSGLMKTALNNVVLPTLFKVVNNIVQHSYT